MKKRPIFAHSLEYSKKIQIFRDSRQTVKKIAVSVEYNSQQHLWIPGMHLTIVVDDKFLADAAFRLFHGFAGIWQNATGHDGIVCWVVKKKMLYSVIVDGF